MILVALDCNVATPSAAAFLSRGDIVFAVITKPMRLMSQRADEADKPTRLKMLRSPRPMRPIRPIRPKQMMPMKQMGQKFDKADNSMRLIWPM